MGNALADVRIDVEMLTVFCPFTREWAVEPFFAAFNAVDIPEHRFIAYVDSDSESLAEKVAARVNGEVILSGLPTPRELGNPATRRPRHAMMRRASQNLIGDGPLLLLEDDTLIPPQTFIHLSETLQTCDWAIGAEVGRWGGTHAPGVWTVKEENGRPVRRIAAMPPQREVDATGFYCVLTTGEVYKRLDFTNWQESFGLDTHATYRLTKAGLKLAVDWRVACTHMTETRHYTMKDAHPLTLAVKWGTPKTI